MTNPTLDEATLKQLALIRLLYLQGVEQSGRPEPFSLFSLLTFHDAVELFLILATEHLNAPVPTKGDPGFMDYWHILRRTDAFPAGVNLLGKGRIERLNRNRNAFKHVGSPPSQSHVDDGLRSATIFFEDNTEPVFGMAFDAIDLADVVPQEDIRKHLKAAAVAEEAGKRKEAMAGLAWAFSKLFDPYTQRQFSPYGFGGKMPRTAEANGIAAQLFILATELRSRQAGNMRSAAKHVDRNIAQLNAAVSAMQGGMRVLALGIDYSRYTRFQRLTPTVLRDDDPPSLLVDADYAPTREEYDYCVQFVISVALRLAEVEASAVMPSWERARTAGSRSSKEMINL